MDRETAERNTSSRERSPSPPPSACNELVLYQPATMGSIEQDAVGTIATIKQEPERGEERQHFSLLRHSHPTPTSADVASSPSRTDKATDFTHGLPSLPTQNPEMGLNNGTKRDYTSMISQTQETQQSMKHDPRSEPLPMVTTNRAAFLFAEKIAGSIPKDIMSIIERSTYGDEDFAFLKDQANNTAKVYTSTEIRVGLKGDSGTGKSSLINSLLGYDGIAPSGNNGEACTAVVQEFRKPRPSQKTPFEAEITFMPPATREYALKTWLMEFWDTQKSDPDEDEDEDNDDDDEDDSDEALEDAVKSGEVSVTAADAIYSLFSDHDECEDLEETKAFLKSAKGREDPEMLAKLKIWMEALLKKLGVESGKAIIGETTPERFQDAIAPFLAHVNGEASPWPLVKIVRCYFDCPILSQDIVLADLPGTSDVNKDRVKATKHYMSDVHYTGVVTKISRAQSDKATNLSLVGSYKRKRGPNLFLVATHADSTGNIKTPSTIDKFISNLGASASDIKEVNACKDELEMIKFDLQVLESNQKRAKSRKDYELLDELEDRHSDLRARKTNKLNQIAEHCIRIRNEKVRKALIARHYPLIKHPLPVFCISSSEYITHVVGYDEDHLPKMSVEATEIPNLRTYIYSLPARQKVIAFRHQLKCVLPSLINSMVMTCSQSKLKRREELEKILLDAQETVSKDIKQVFTALLEMEILAKISKIKSAPKKMAYGTAASKRLNAYTQWSSRTQKVFCLHKGQWSTRTVGHKDWNAELLEPLVNDVKDVIQPWDDISEILSRNLSEKVTTIMQSLIAELEETAGPSRGILNPFFAEFHLKTNIMDGLCKAEAEEVERGLYHIKHCMISSTEIESCYLVQALEQTYKECANMTGAGVRQHRLDKLKVKLVEKKITNPYHKVHDKAKSAGEKLFENHRKILTERILKNLEQLHDIFMIFFKTDENDAPEAKALRTQLRDNLPTFQARIAECERLLESCEQAQQMKTEKE